MNSNHHQNRTRQALKLASLVGAASIYLISCTSPAYARAFQDAHQHHHERPAAATPDNKKDEALLKLSVPDLPVVDQDGKQLRFYSDLIKNRVVAINFIFTTCTTICPPLAATFSRLQTLLGSRFDRDVLLVSVSVDPVTDTPARLKAWGDKFGRKPGWTLVSGNKSEVDQLLKALNAYVARKEDHTPMAIVGNDRTAKWTRTYGLAPATTLANLIQEMADGDTAGRVTQSSYRPLSQSPGAASAPASDQSPAQKYFTDVELINQDGKPMRFYSDLLKGKVVIINSFFTTCTSVCPPMTQTLSKIQGWLDARLGKDVLMLSISVDPVTDTPPRLKDYAVKFGVKPGWYLLTGKQENVHFVLRKLGQAVAEKNDHFTILIIGNMRTGLWKKAFGLAKPDDLIKVVDSVMHDKGGAGN